MKPLTLEERTTKRLLTLHSTLATLDGYTSKKARGEFLIEMLEKYPWMEFYLRTACDLDVNWGFSCKKDAWKKFIKELPGELRELATNIVNKQVPKLSPKFINKVFVKSGRDAIENPVRRVKAPSSPYTDGLSIEVTGDGGMGVALADMLLGHTKVASMFLYHSSDLKKTLELLRGFGVVINVPKHVEKIK